MDNNEMFKYELNASNLVPEFADEFLKHSKHLDELATFMDRLNRRFTAINGTPNASAEAVIKACREMSKSFYTEMANGIFVNIERM